MIDLVFFNLGSNHAHNFQIGLNLWVGPILKLLMQLLPEIYSTQSIYYKLITALQARFFKKSSFGDL